jgi:hypothetical protein
MAWGPGPPLAIRSRPAPLGLCALTGFGQLAQCDRVGHAVTYMHMHAIDTDDARMVAYSPTHRQRQCMHVCALSILIMQNHD